MGSMDFKKREKRGHKIGGREGRDGKSGRRWGLRDEYDQNIVYEILNELLKNCCKLLT